MLQKERQRLVLQSFDGRPDPRDRREICKSIGGEAINDGMHIDRTRSLKPAEEEHAHAQHLARGANLQIALPEAGVDAFQKVDLLGAELPAALRISRLKGCGTR